MTGLKDFFSFLLPVPPTILMRNGEFPNCSEIFEAISKNPPQPRLLGRIFSRLCSLVGFCWLIWTLNTLVFVAGILVFLYHWGKGADMATPLIFGFLSCQMLIAILCALLFVGKMIFTGVATISNQFSDRCYEHVNATPPSPRKSGKAK